LQNYVDPDIVSELNKREFIYSALLEDVVMLTKTLTEEKINWRIQECYLLGLGNAITYFNANEINDKLGQHVYEMMKKNCD
jgi:hypothetical protein